MIRYIDDANSNTSIHTCRIYDVFGVCAGKNCLI